jgi:ribosomal protein L11 methyltransferase
LIRLAVRCTPEQADLVLAELTVLAPNGVEEERGPDYVEFAIYGGEGELPELGDLDAAIAGGRVEVSSTEIPDDWADRWRDFHKPLLVADRLWLRPSWEAPRAGAVDVVVDPGQAFGTGAHPTTRLCLQYLCELERAGEARGELVDLGTGSGVLAIAAAKLGWGPIRGYDHEPAALEAAAANAAANDVELSLKRANLREDLPELAPTVVANMTAPILLAVAGLMKERWREPGEGSADNSGEGPPTPPPATETVVCSGLLPGEVDEVAAAFSLSGLGEANRCQDGGWAAVLLRRS